jgi:DNA-binding CsgD family transcriptional regulator
MKMGSTTLTKEERDVIILAAQRPRVRRLTNAEIAQSLGISAIRVKTLIHNTCVKMKVHNRNEAILFAMIRGEISPTAIYSLGELAEIFSSLSPDVLTSIANLVRQKLEHGHIRGRYKRVIPTNRRQHTILTRRERDVLSLAGRGLTNKEIADRLCMTAGAVRTFLNRACTKLGATTRADAVVFAIKEREISVGDIASFDELLQALAPLGAEAIERMAQLVIQEHGQEAVPTSS